MVLEWFCSGPIEQHRFYNGVPGVPGHFRSGPKEKDTVLIWFCFGSNENVWVLRRCCLRLTEKKLWLYKGVPGVPVFLLRVQRKSFGFTLVLFTFQRKRFGFTLVLLRVQRNKNGFTLVLLKVQRTILGFTVVLLMANGKHWFYKGVPGVLGYFCLVSEEQH